MNFYGSLIRKKKWYPTLPESGWDVNYLWRSRLLLSSFSPLSLSPFPALSGEALGVLCRQRGPDVFAELESMLTQGIRENLEREGGGAGGGAPMEEGEEERVSGR